MATQTVDLAGIGIGPFNLGLAALLSGQRDIGAVFYERKPAFNWHGGMLLPGATLQVPFLADLVTLADPTHPLSYLNYLHQHDRLFQFYYLDNSLVPRQEYDHYCRWVAAQLPACQFGLQVDEVVYDRASSRFLVHSSNEYGKRDTVASRDLVVGVGTTPWLPTWARGLDHPRLIHSAQFLPHQAELAECRHVTVIGSGQSAAECVLALLRELTPEQVAAGKGIRWITRAPGFHPMEFSKLGQECFTPDYMHYFHSIPRERRREVVAGQGLLYKGISFSTIADVFDLMYERSIGGRDPGLVLNSNCDITAAETDDKRLTLHCHHRQLDQHCILHTDAVIAATGYAHAWPAWFEALKGEVLSVDSHGNCIVSDDFQAQRCDGGGGRIFVQNAEIFQHGVGSPDLGIGPIRNAKIINQLLGISRYRLPARSAFQEYGLPRN